MSQPAAGRRTCPPAFTIRLTVALGMVLGLATSGGCANQTFKGLRNPFAGGVKLSDPFRRSSEADFIALVKHQCAGLAVGTDSVGGLLASDKAFQDATSELYRGDLSNDEYLNQVLRDHPAVDANVPAVGCIVNTMQTCLSGACTVAAATAASRLTEPAPTAPPVPPDEAPAPATMAPATVVTSMPTRGAPADKSTTGTPPTANPAPAPTTPAPATRSVPDSTPATAPGTPAPTTTAPLPWRG